MSKSHAKQLMIIDVGTYKGSEKNNHNKIGVKSQQYCGDGLSIQQKHNKLIQVNSSHFLAPK